MLGLGLLQPSEQKFRQNLHEPVFTENNSIIEDLSQQRTNVKMDEDYGMVNWNDLDKMREVDVEETPDERRSRMKKKGNGYLTD